MLHSIEVDAAPLEALPHSVASVAVVCYLPLRDVVALTIASRRLRDRCVASLDYWRTASTLSRMALARSVWVEEDLSAAVRRMRRHESLRGRGLRLGGQSLMERHVHSVLGAIWMAAPLQCDALTKQSCLFVSVLRRQRYGHCGWVGGFDRAAGCFERSKATRYSAVRVAAKAAFVARLRSALVEELSIERSIREA